MVRYSIETDRARDLADRLVRCAARATDLEGDVRLALGLSELDSDAVVRLGELAADLRRAGARLRARADAADEIDAVVDAVTGGFREPARPATANTD